MANKKAQHDVSTGFSDSEGFPLPVTSASSAPGTQQVQIDFTKAPAPKRRFLADGFCVIQAVDTFRLVFVQSKIDGKTPRAVLDIHVAIEVLDQFLNVLKDMPEPPQEYLVEPTTLTSEPEQTIALTANFCRASMHQVVALIDFFYASPLSYQDMLQKNVLRVDDVVRLQLSPAVMMSFISALRKLGLSDIPRINNDFFKPS